ncbi:hypothetical protein HOE04_02535 [archaeon]|nr:hypothetical protein [archaeon]
MKKEFERIQKAGKYLEGERKKLIREKEKIRAKIRKEKEILRLKKKIKNIKSKKF